MNHESKEKFNLREFRNVLGRYPTGVTIVTTRTRGDSPEDIGVTMNSFCTVSLNPPLVLFCVDKKAFSLEAFQRADVFGINFLSEGQDTLSTKFAKALDNKWADAPVERGMQGVPLIKGAIAQLQCTPYKEYEGGDHIIFLVCVQDYRVFSGRDPLGFCQGRYNHLKPGPVAPPDWPLPIHY